MSTRKAKADDVEAVETPEAEAPADEGTPGEVVALADLPDVERPGKLPQAVKDRHRAQYGEFGQWVAAYDIHTPAENALAYAAGHPIPADMVDDDGRVAVSRHRCHHTPDVRCEKFNEPDSWTAPGAAVRPPHFKE